MRKRMWTRVVRYSGMMDQVGMVKEKEEVVVGAEMTGEMEERACWGQESLSLTHTHRKRVHYMKKKFFFLS